jgi:hypothetical protein
MKDLSNIDKSAFRRGEYIGYANGTYRITRSTSSYGKWHAQPIPLYDAAGNQRPAFYGFTLSQINANLVNLNK